MSSSRVIHGGGMKTKGSPRTLWLALSLAGMIAGGCASDPRGDLLAQRIKERAEVGARAYQEGNFDVMVDQTYPGLVAQLGGRRQAIATMKAAMSEMHAKGYQFGGLEFDEPDPPVGSNGQLFAVVPETVTVATRDATFTQESYMLAISQDDGVTWTFIDGTTLTPALVAQLFPNFPKSLKLPKQTQPTIKRRT